MTFLCLGNETGQTKSSTGRPYTRLRRSHGALNMLGWGILMIIGVIVARHLKSYDPLWFYLHICIQSFAFVFGIIGVICGFVLDNKTNADVSTHKALGIFILVLGCLQVCHYSLFSLSYKHNLDMLCYVAD